MNDEKKEPSTMEETDPVADELVVIDLRNQIRELKEREMHLEYQLSGMGDMARMNCASHILAAKVGSKAFQTRGAAIDSCIEMADELISHYQEIIEKNAVEYQKKVAEMEDDRKEDDDTVQ